MGKPREDEEGAGVMTTKSIKQATPGKAGDIIDTTAKVKVDVTGSPFHKAGVHEMAPSVAEKMEKNGWGKRLAALVLFAFMSFGAIAQLSVIAPMYNPANTYSLALLNATTVTRDTVTNAGTGYINSKRIAGAGEVTIQANVTYVSGTVAGSLTLWGSLDGVNYAVIPTTETQTSVTVGSLTSQAGTKAWVWRLVGSDFLYYRVVQSGGTTAVSYLDGYIMKH